MSIHLKLLLVAFLLDFGADEVVDLSLFIADSCSSDNSLLRDAKPSRSSSFRSDKVLVRSTPGSDGIST